MGKQIDFRKKNRNTPHHEGRQAKYVTRRTDYEDPTVFQWQPGISLTCVRLGKSGGPARRGLALFRFTFVRTKVNPGVWGRGGPIDNHRGWGQSLQKRKPPPPRSRGGGIRLSQPLQLPWRHWWPSPWWWPPQPPSPWLPQSWSPSWWCWHMVSGLYCRVPAASAAAAASASPVTPG